MEWFYVCEERLGKVVVPDDAWDGGVGLSSVLQIPHGLRDNCGVWMGVISYIKLNAAFDLMTGHSSQTLGPQHYSLFPHLQLGSKDTFVMNTFVS